MEAGKNEILKIFLKEVCGKGEVYINGEELLLPINAIINDDKLSQNNLLEYSQKRDTVFFGNKTFKERDKEKQLREKICEEKFPIIKISNVDGFKDALYEYTTTYLSKNIMWTTPAIAEERKDIMLFAMSYIWTNATRNDFENPIAFLKRYTNFLTENQWEDLKKPEQTKIPKLWRTVEEAIEERETPFQYTLFTIDENGKKQYLPSICYGIEGDKAYIYAIQQLHNRANENDTIKNLRKAVKGRGIEPLAIISLLDFIGEAKTRGIKKICMPDYFILQYLAKKKTEERMYLQTKRYDIINKLKGAKLGSKEAEELVQEIFSAVKEDRVESLLEDSNFSLTDELRQEIIECNTNWKVRMEELDKVQKHSINNKLKALFLVSQYYSRGIKFLEIPGDVSDNYVVDITNFRLGKEEKPKLDRRKKEKEGR